MIKDKIRRIIKYTVPILLWAIGASVIGLLGGLLGTGLYKSIDAVTFVRDCNRWIVWLLPVGGLVIVALYKLCRVDTSSGTNVIIDSVRTERKPPVLLIPLIFIGTVITHLFGGSAGREGAALQLGGSLGNCLGKIVRLDKKNTKLAVMCGMSAVFSALFGTPLAAAVFTIEVISVGAVYYAALTPCLVSSIVAWLTARLSGIPAAVYELPSLSSEPFMDGLKVSGLALLCSLLSIIFCIVLHQSEKWAAKFIKNKFLRIAVCGLIIAVLTFFVRSGDYNGAGADIIAAAVGGNSRPEAFLLKILFTAITLAGGYKGGEIVPTFFIGATFGCTVGSLLGLPPGFGAAIGMCAMFCGVVNCPMASAFLAIELFGGKYFLFFFIAICISYVFSGYYGLYGSQKILYAKNRLEFIDRMAE